MASDEEDRRLDEERAALVLERAARLDAGRLRDVDLAELREAALEAGISPVAFERALVEVEEEARAADPAPKPTPRSGAADEEPGLASWSRRALLGVTGFVLGTLPVVLAGMGLDMEAGMIFSFVLAFQAFLWLVVRHRKRGTVADFEIDLGVLWAVLTLVFMVAFADDADEVAGIMSIVWGISAIVGGLGVGLLRRPEDDEGRRLPPAR